MSRRFHLSLKGPAPAHNNAARSKRRAVTMGKRARISSAVLRGPYLPPEDWYEPRETATKGNFRIVKHAAGPGFRHVLSEADVRQRLAQLPAWMIETLEVVHLTWA